MRFTIRLRPDKLRETPSADPHARCCGEGGRLWIVATKADSAMLESVDFFKNKFACQEEPCRRQHTRAISEMLQQDDYTELKRNPDAVAEGMEQLKAIGNGQIPGWQQHSDC